MATKEYFIKYRNEHKERLAQTRRIRYYKKLKNISEQSIKELKKLCGKWTEKDELLLKAYLSRLDVKLKIHSVGEDLVIKEYLQKKINNKKSLVLG